MTAPRYRPPGDVRMIWLIARRAAGEALRDRLTLLVSLFFAIVLPLGLVVFVVHPLRGATTRCWAPSSASICCWSG